MTPTFRPERFDKAGNLIRETYNPEEWTPVDGGLAARTVGPGKTWAFTEHRTMAEVITDEIPAGHSGIGGSGMERWEKCVGSVELIKELQLHQTDDETEYAAEGNAAHAMAAKGLETGTDTWELIPETFHGMKLNTEQALHVQSYIDFVRGRYAALVEEYGSCEMFVEHRLVGNHPSVYGTVDCGLVAGDYAEIIDLKFGVGISVDVEWNKQEMYYAHLFQVRHPEVRRFQLWIYQPRGHHRDGPERKWPIGSDDLGFWADTYLYPAVARVEAGGGLLPGEHCRFCPLKLVCPSLHSLARAAFEYDTQQLVNVSNEHLGQILEMIVPALEHFIKAAKDEGFKRNMDGQVVPGTHLEYGRARERVWNEGALDELRKTYDDNIIFSREMKSPKQMEDAGAPKTLIKKLCNLPRGKLKLALSSSGGTPVRPQTSQEVFGKALDAYNNS